MLFNTNNRECSQGTAICQQLLLKTKHRGQVSSLQYPASRCKQNSEEIGIKCRGNLCLIKSLKTQILCLNAHKPSAFLEKASTSHSLTTSFLSQAEVLKGLYTCRYNRSKTFLSRHDYSSYVANCFTRYQFIQRERIFEASQNMRAGAAWFI